MGSVPYHFEMVVAKSLAGAYDSHWVDDENQSEQVENGGGDGVEVEVGGTIPAQTDSHLKSGENVSKTENQVPGLVR